MNNHRKIGRYTLLLLSLFCIIGLRPFFEVLVGITLMTDLLFICVLISGVYTLNKHSVIFRISCLFVIAIIALQIAHYVLNKIEYLHLLRIWLNAFFVTQVLIVIMRHLLVEQEVSGDLIMGGACAFILLGIDWSFFYYLLEVYYPNSFNISIGAGGDLSDFFYFSFVTLTSVGYGDILAVSKQARGVASLEAIVGQLYLAIMVARLVGLHSEKIKKV